MLLSAHFAVADLNLTTAMVAMDDRYKHLQLPSGPFDYRMFPVLLWHALAWILRPLQAAHPGLRLPDLHQPFTSNEGWFLFVLTFFSMLGTLLVARRMLREINPDWRFEWLALGMAYAAYFDSILVLNRNLFYPYDPPGLFFFTLLVYLAWSNRPLLFSLALAVAMLNKETAAMTILVFFFLQVGRRRLPQLIALCVAMGAIVLAVRFAEVTLVHHTCGACDGADQYQLGYNLSQFTNPLFWLSESSVFGFSWVTLILLWRYIPRRLQVAGAVIYGIWLAGMMCVGVMREVRIFSELSALLLLLIAEGLNEYLLQRSRHVVPLPPLAEV